MSGVFSTLLKTDDFCYFARGKSLLGRQADCCRCGLLMCVLGLSIAFIGLSPSPSCPTLQGSHSLGPSSSWESMTSTQRSPTSHYRLRPVSELCACVCLRIPRLPVTEDVDPTTEAKLTPPAHAPKTRASGAQMDEVKPGVCGEWRALWTIFI